jgi:hypothetical protein
MQIAAGERNSLRGEAWQAFAAAQNHLALRLPVSLARIFGLFKQPESIVDSRGLRNLIADDLRYARLEEAAIPVHATATSLEGIPVLLSGQVLMDGAIAQQHADFGGGAPRRRT